MKTGTKTISAALAAMLCCAILADAIWASAALAKRVGGGGSFGGRSSYSRSYTPPSSAPYAPSSPSQPTAPAARPATQQQAATPTPPMAQPQAPGMFSRFGWGLGGFMAGGLLGSMLFGNSGGMGWGGGGIGLMDILLIGLVAYLGYRLLRRRSSAPAGQPQNQPGTWRQDTPAASGPGSDDPRSRAEASWDHLRSTPPANSQPGAQANAQAAAQSPTGGFGVAPQGDPAAGPVVPEGFNVPEFLEGAKTVYGRLQHSWDRRDLNDIALFTTQEVLAEIRRQAAADPAPSKTELLLVNAKLLEFREEDADIVATVLFDVLMREDASEERPKQIREVWHFSRPAADLSANWRLEGIQQLEA
ncbi:MAG: TIM44-like domain-containing protein [Desulfovibrio sp.]|jgi:predicted lipid-binding transport protein (Tim44 family)|nr:TIM44-like domain-containing protein [Desulfovibrio sp.]